MRILTVSQLQRVVSVRESIFIYDMGLPAVKRIEISGGGSCIESLAFPGGIILRIVSLLLHQNVLTLTGVSDARYNEE